MKRPLYYLLCAMACTSMVGATMPMAAIAEAIQPPATAEHQAQADATTSDTGEAKDGTNTNVTADTAEDGTATSTGTSAANTKSADATTAATDTPAPSLRAQTNGTPEAISVAAETGYAHSATASQNGVTLTLGWNDVVAGEPTTFHLSATGGSSTYKFRMDAPFYMNPGEGYFGEMVADTSRGQWMTWTSSKKGCDYEFTMTASGRYYYRFYLQDAQSSVWSLRVAAEIEVSNDAHPSVNQIITNAVAQCRQETNGSEYDMAQWLHDWTLDQLEYDHSLNWCSAESGLTRHQGTCESYQRIYSKLLDAAGIANGRITGNGHTWNAVKIDGKWCQMDLTWDDTNDNWYGDLDQRHLYFGLTDELMAIAHSDHTANYQKDGYAYRSTDLSNNYFVRNDKADEWAEKYADRIQQHLDAKEESFSINADNQSFPPSISGIQNGIIVHAINAKKWEASNSKVNLIAITNYTSESNDKRSTKFKLKVQYVQMIFNRVLNDGPYRLVPSLAGGMAIEPAASGCALSSGAGALQFERDAATGLYRISSHGRMLTESGCRAVLAKPDGSSSQLWRVATRGAGYSLTSASGLALDDWGLRTAEGSAVGLHEPNAGAAQTWLLADSEIPRTVEDGPYRLVPSLAGGMAVEPAASGCALSSGAGALQFERDAATGLYRISSHGRMLTESGCRAVLAKPDGSSSQLWRVATRGAGYSLTSASGLALDDWGLRTAEGSAVGLHEPNAGAAQRWLLADAAFISPATILTKFI